METNSSKKRGEISGYILSADGRRIVPILRVEIVRNIRAESAAGLATKVNELFGRAHWTSSSPNMLTACCSSEIFVKAELEYKDVDVSEVHVIK